MDPSGQCGEILYHPAPFYLGRESPFSLGRPYYTALTGHLPVGHLGAVSVTRFKGWYFRDWVLWRVLAIHWGILGHILHTEELL